MAKKTYRDPVAKAQAVLTDTPHKAEWIAERLAAAGYKPSTVQSQIFNLRHWKGCNYVEGEGYSRNPDYVAPEKVVKAKKEKKEKVAKVKKAPKAPKAKKPKTFHPAPKPSDKEAA